MHLGKDTSYIVQHITKNSLALNIFGSSQPEMFYEKGALKNFAKFTGKHLFKLNNEDTITEVYLELFQISTNETL